MVGFIRWQVERISEMKLISKVVFSILVYCAVPAIGAANAKSVEEILTYYGASDASAGVAVGKEMFVVADDENNVLRFYKTNQAGLPVFSYDLTEFLDIDPEYPEADIEGATMVGDRIYWITSHGRNRDGKIRPNRYRFFATSVEVQNQNITIRPIGTPSKTLVHHLVKTPAVRHLGLDRATRFDASTLKKLAPKKQGLNIEGLCASPDGKIMYIGFRNPRPVNKKTRRAEALLMPLNNAKQVIEGAQEPIFGEPILWDLKGCGIRSMEYSHFHKAYFIIAGPHNEESNFALYRWSGEKNAPPSLVQQIDTDNPNFNPEALVTFKNSAGFLILSDDGSLVIDVSSASECMEGRLRSDGKCLNKYLTNPEKKYFRGIWLKSGI